MSFVLVATVKLKLHSKIFLQSVNFAAFKDCAISRFYEKKRAEGKDHLTAIGHVCYKMLAIIFAVLRDNKAYVPAPTS